MQQQNDNRLKKWIILYYLKMKQLYTEITYISSPMH